MALFFIRLFFSILKRRSQKTLQPWSDRRVSDSGHYHFWSKKDFFKKNPSTKKLEKWKPQISNHCRRKGTMLKKAWRKMQKMLTERNKNLLLLVVIVSASKKRETEERESQRVSLSLFSKLERQWKVLGFCPHSLDSKYPDKKAIQFLKTCSFLVTRHYFPMDAYLYVSCRLQSTIIIRIMPRCLSWLRELWLPIRFELQIS